MDVTILMPVYNDWESAARLCERIEGSLAGRPLDRFSVMLIDDGSSQAWQPFFENIRLPEFRHVEILRLRRNLGHQRAITVGLSYLHEQHPPDYVVVMDADGEDRPEHIPQLLETGVSHPGALIFAERGRRVEGLLFRTFYAVYKGLHWLAVGAPIRVGNFSAVPRDALARLVVVAEMWNHYAAAVLKSRIPYETIRLDRGHRLAGKSQMNFVSLVIHGLSALFVYHELVGARLLMAASAAAVLLALTSAGVLLFATERSVSNLLLIAGSILLLLAGEALLISIAVIFFVMMGRSTATVVPLRDYRYFVLDKVDALRVHD